MNLQFMEEKNSLRLIKTIISTLLPFINQEEIKIKFHHQLLVIKVLFDILIKMIVVLVQFIAKVINRM